MSGVVLTVARASLKAAPFHQSPSPHGTTESRRCHRPSKPGNPDGKGKMSVRVTVCVASSVFVSLFVHCAIRSFRAPLEPNRPSSDSSESHPTVPYHRNGTDEQAPCMGHGREWSLLLLTCVRVRCGWNVCCVWLLCRCERDYDCKSS